jgi:hypothetical protein
MLLFDSFVALQIHTQLVFVKTPLLIKCIKVHVVLDFSFTRQIECNIQLLLPLVKAIHTKHIIQ